MNKKTIELIKYFEGFSPKIYKCQAGIDTIGFGHALRKGEKFDIITHAEAEELLQQDILIAYRNINQLLKVTLNENQIAAIISFVFNVGVAAFARSTLRQKINREEHEVVPKELMRWVYAGGFISKGLVKRRKMEGEIYSALDFE